MSRQIGPPPGLWSTFRARVAALATLGRELRLLMLIAIAQILLAAVLIALRDVKVHTTTLAVLGSGTTVVPLPLLWITVAFMTISWAYLLAAAFRGHVVAGLIGLAAYGAALIPMSQDVGWHGAAAVVRGVAVAGVVAVGVASWRRVRLVRDPRVAVVVLAALVAAVYGTFAWDAAVHSVFRAFSYGDADQLMAVSFFLLPLLFLTGAEFAEWAEVIGDRVAFVAARIGSTRALVALAGAISMAVLVSVVIEHGVQIPSQAVLFGLGAWLVVWRVRRAWPAAGWGYEVPWLALALVACAFIGILLIEVYRTAPTPVRLPTATGAQLREYRHATQPGFLIDVPDRWRVVPVSSIVSFQGGGDSFYVDALPVHEGPDEGPLLPGVLGRLFPGVSEQIGVGHEDLGWRRTTFALGTGLRGVAWERPIGTRDWLLMGVAPSRADPLFGSMWRSFTASGAPATPLSGASQLAHRRLDPYRYDPVLVVPFLAWLAVTVVAGVGLGWIRRRGPAGLTLGVAFVFAFGLLFVLSEVRQVLEELFDARPGPVYSLRLPGIQGAVAVGTLVALLARRGLDRPRLTNLVILGAGLQLLAWISHLYKTAALVGERLSIAQAVVIVLALLWELVVSSEPVMSGDTRAVPRALRVLALCGYVMLVATAVMFFSSLREHGSGALLEPQFESEGWPALGIVQLGVPALLFVVALRLGTFRPRERAPARPRAAPSRATWLTALPRRALPAGLGRARPPGRR